jgi:hypothetical protein
MTETTTWKQGNYTVSCRYMPSAVDFKSAENDVVYAIWEWVDSEVKVLKISFDPKHATNAKMYQDGVIVSKCGWSDSWNEKTGCTALNGFDGLEKCFVLNIDESTHGRTDIVTVLSFFSMNDLIEYMRDTIQHFVDNRCGLCAYTDDEDVLKKEVLDTLNELIQHKKVVFGECMRDYVVHCSEMTIDH